MDTAKKIVSYLLEKKMIACANIFPINSTYWWKGEITNADEIVSLVKTTNEKADVVEAEVLKIHPYEVPCIIRTEVSANASYEEWIRAQVTLSA